MAACSARKLGLKTTGHAGGLQHLTLPSRLTLPGDHLNAMLHQLGRDLFVTESMGQGVTGDYSRCADGYGVGLFRSPGALG